MVNATLKWEYELVRWLKPFLDRLVTRLGDGCVRFISRIDCTRRSQSVQPMAARLALVEYYQLHHFIADGLWDAAPLYAELLVQADLLVGC